MTDPDLRYAREQVQERDVANHLLHDAIRDLEEELKATKIANTLLQKENQRLESDNERLRKNWNILRNNWNEAHSVIKRWVSTTELLRMHEE